MPHHIRRAAAVAAYALAATALVPGAAHAAARAPLPATTHTSVATKPSLAASQPAGRTVTADSHGLVATLTPVRPAASGLGVELDATASHTERDAHITGYRFTFGDGQSVTDATGRAQHHYERPGAYHVTLTVTDSARHSVTTQSTVVLAGSDYTPTAPTRLLDTRSGLGAPKAKLTTTSEVRIPITGVDGIPDGATGVVLSLLALDTVDNGAITCYPDATSEPSASNMNFGGGATVDNLLTIPLPADGEIDCALSGDANSSADLVGDLEGYYSPSSSDTYMPEQPGRLVDTRSGLGAAKAKLSNGHALAIAVTGATANTSVSSTVTTTETLPTAGITAVAINVTTVDSTGTGVLTAYPDGSAAPSGAILNYWSPSTYSNAAIVPVGADGKIDIDSSATETTSTDVLVDIEGYYTANTTGSVYVPAAITRILDTRTTAGGAVIAGDYVNLNGLTTANGITAYILNATVIGPTANGNICAFPTGSIDPLDVTTSNLNYGDGTTLAKFVQATAGSTGVSFFNQAGSGSTQLIVDMFGYFAEQ